MILRLSLTFVLGFVALLGDIIVQKLDRFSHLKVIADNGTHAVIGGLTWTIVCLQQRMPLFSNESILQITACFVLSSFIDIDHFVMVGSFKLQDIQSMQDRPFFHCSTLTLGTSLAVVSLSYVRSSELLHLVGWLSLTAFASHHTRDATRRGYWCYPVGSTPPLHYWAYIAISASLPYLIAFLFLQSKPTRQYQTIVNLAKSQYITI